MSLSDLLHLVAGGRLAGDLLDRPGWLARLARATAGQWGREPGIGPAGAARLVAAFELGRRVECEAVPPRPLVRSPADVFDLVEPRMRGLTHEIFLVLLLSSKGRVEAVRSVGRGTLDASLVDPREVFGPALRESAGSIVLVHNHPSGDPTPSPEDLLVTERLVEIGALMGIEVVDHIVVGDRKYVSLCESKEAIRSGSGRISS